MDMRILRYFLEVANQESFTKAALRLHITQPTLSRQISQLEGELGRKLYTRESYGISLTEEGLLLKKRAGEILELEEKIREELSCSDIRGTVCIGAGETAGVSHIARVLRKLMEAYPGITYRMISADAEDVGEKLDRGLVDFGLFVGKVSLNKYDCLDIPGGDRWGLIVRSDDELAFRDFITPDDLKPRALLSSHQAKSYGEFTEWLGYPADELNIAGTHNLAYNAAVMVREGLGVLLTIEGIVNMEGLEFVPLMPELRAGLVLAWKKGAVFSKASRKFLELISQGGE